MDSNLCRDVRRQHPATGLETERFIFLGGGKEAVKWLAFAWLTPLRAPGPTSRGLFISGSVLARGLAGEVAKFPARRLSVMADDRYIMMPGGMHNLQN
jgi:hypothetical protein